MKAFLAAANQIASFILRSLDMLELDEWEKFVNLLIEAYKENKKVLVVGAGRSGLVGRAFAMRLMHLGYNVYVLGETITPAVSRGDVVIAISGSGRTKLVLVAAEAAKTIGAKLVAITSFRDSPLAKIADLVVYVPGRTKVSAEDDYFRRQVLGLHEPLAPLGTLFEDTTMVLLDALIVELMQRLGKTEEDLRLRHANIE